MMLLSVSLVGRLLSAHPASHTHNAFCHCCCCPGNKLCIVMEFAPAGDLSSFLKAAAASKRPLPEATLWQIFLQLCQGMQVRTHSRQQQDWELAAAGRQTPTPTRQSMVVAAAASAATCGWLTLTCCAVLFWPLLLTLPPPGHP